MMIKTEKDVINSVVKIWGLIMSLFATSLFTKTFSLADVDKYLGALNAALFLIVAVYSIYCTITAVKDCKAFPYIFAVFSGGLLCLTMTILQICWFNVDQVLIVWLNLLWTSAESATALYIGFVIHLIHTASCSQKECKEKEA